MTGGEMAHKAGAPSRKLACGYVCLVLMMLLVAHLYAVTRFQQVQIDYLLLQVGAMKRSELQQMDANEQTYKDLRSIYDLIIRQQQESAKQQAKNSQSLQKILLRMINRAKQQ